MPVNKIFDHAFSLAAKAMDLRNERQGLIQSNIANMETPGYVAQDFPFAKVMERAMSGRGELTKTHSKHIDPDPVEMSKVYKSTTEGRAPDLDEEMLKLSENQLMYQATARIIRKKIEGLKYVIDEGGK